jgi:tripartite-type tricarboxylate transporter receptor subunit TctC
MIKKIIGIVFLHLILMFTAVHAKEITFAFYYPPGGATDKHAEALISSLQKRDVKVEKKFFKTCVEALDHSKNSNSYVIGLANDLHTSPTGKCPPLKQSYSEIKLYTTIGDISTMFCTVPKRSDISWSTLTDSSRSILVGTLTADVNWLPFHLFLKHSKKPLKIKVIPYSGAGDLQIAASAGNIDMFFIGGVAAQLVKQGSKCLASSTRENWGQAPFIGDFTNFKNFPETKIQTAIFFNKMVPDDVDTAMRSALSSESFLKDMQKINASHSGLGAGFSSDEQIKNVKKMNNFFDELKNNNKN